MTYEEMFVPFEGKIVRIDLYTRNLTLKDLRIGIRGISSQDDSILITLKSGGSLQFYSPYEPVLNEEGRLFCTNNKNEWICLTLLPLQVLSNESFPPIL
jgi:hypothetical protein